MTNDSLKRLETAVLARNPLLREQLQPGLSEARVRRILTRKKVMGDIECLIRLYTWKGGTWLNEHPSLEKGFLPGSAEPYHFPELEMALGHFDFFKEAALNHPRISEAVGRYFPAFWNGSDDSLAIDLKPGNRNRVILIEFNKERPFREAYSSFEEFLTDAIRASEDDVPLACFRQE